MLPLDRIEGLDAFLAFEELASFGPVLERAGFEGCGLTDHPCPTGRWLDAGGHHAPDPFVALSIVAATTKNLRLQTAILVLPYRNPFITARAAATLDYLSGGRLTLGVGAGYLKGEYKALGVDFERRNELMDEYIRALKAAWQNDEFTFEGSGYTALGNRIAPRPVQRPHPPILIGGNSKRAIRRAVELGDAWNPFVTVAALPSTARTAALADETDLAEGIRYLRAYSEEFGRSAPPDIVLVGLTPPDDSWHGQAILDRLGSFKDLGVKSGSVYIGGKTPAEWRDNAERFGAEVLSNLP